MYHTWKVLTAGLIALGAQVAVGQESPDANRSNVNSTAQSPAADRTERRVERRQLRRSGELPAVRANAAANANSPAAGGVNVAVPAAGVDVNTAPGAGVGVNVPGVGVNVPPAGSRAGVDVNVPAAGVQANVNPNAWRYRWHDSRWWYYHPNNRWSFWNDNRWNVYPIPATTAANKGTTRRFSNTPRYESGYRGPSVNPGTGTGASGSLPSGANTSPLERANPGDASVPAGP